MTEDLEFYMCAECFYCRSADINSCPECGSDNILEDDIDRLVKAAKNWFNTRSQHPINIDDLANAEYELVKAVKGLE